MYKHNMSMILRVCIFPFTSIAYYRQEYMMQLSEVDQYKKYKEIYDRELKFVLYEDLRQRYNIHTLDAIDLAMTKYYSYPFVKGKYVQHIYMQILSRLARSFISHRNGRLALKYWESDGDEAFIGPYKGINKIALWNELNRMMCTELIAIQYLIDNNMADVRYLRGYYSSIMIEDLQLEQVLQKGVAETHIHKGAAINFSITWTHLMNLSLKNTKDYEEFYLSKDIYSQERMQLTIAVMAIMRLLMVDFLANEKIEFLDEAREEQLEQDKQIRALIEAVKAGHIFDEKEITLDELRDLWEDILYHMDIILEGHEEDYIKYFLDDPEEVCTTGENIFIFYALKYLNQPPTKINDDFSYVFFQYLRIKHSVFDAKVQENSIKGLKYFQPIYKKSTVLSTYSQCEYWLNLMRTQFQNKHLKKLEFRFAFYDKKHKMKNRLKKIIRSFLQAYKIFLDEWEAQRLGIEDRDEEENYLLLETPPKIGLVFHMIKSLDEQYYEKCWQNTYDLEDQLDVHKELFYSRNQEEYKLQIKVFNELRTEIPYLDRFLIGIDAASIEDYTEPWVFAPIYQEARDSKDGHVLYSNGQPIQTLGFTFHVGEDFRHILTGLRHVDEVITHFQYHAGDRIGHGIVLGVDIDYWRLQNPIVMLPRGEYLDNLLWVWGVYKTKGHLECLDVTYLEQQIMKLAEEIFECIDGITVYMLWKVYQNKFTCFTTSEKFNCKNNSAEHNKVVCKYIPERFKELGQSWSYEGLCHVQHCYCYLTKILEPIQVQVEEKEVGLFKYLQLLLLEKISNQGIIIESNPTSNLAIGEIQDLFHHYIFNLNKVESHDKEHRAIFSINSDDPSVFNTNVSNEIAYIFYSLQQQGYSREEALQWIDKIRGYGMKSSFLSDEKISCNGLKKRIEYVLQKLDE